MEKIKTNFLANPIFPLGYGGGFLNQDNLCIQTNLQVIPSLDGGLEHFQVGMERTAATGVPYLVSPLPGKYLTSLAQPRSYAV